MIKLMLSFVLLITTAFMESNSLLATNVIETCDSISFVIFKNNLTKVEHLNHGSHNLRAKAYSDIICQTASILCDGLNYSKTMNYVIDDYELSISSYLIPDSAVTQNAYHVNILTIKRNNQLIHSEILADVYKGMTLKLTGFETIDEKRYIVWAHANPLSKPEFGKMRLDINGAVSLKTYECRNEAP